MWHIWSFSFLIEAMQIPQIHSGFLFFCNFRLIDRLKDLPDSSIEMFNCEFCDDNSKMWKVFDKINMYLNWIFFQTSARYHSFYQCFEILGTDIWCRFNTRDIFVESGIQRQKHIIDRCNVGYIIQLWNFF